jgi:ubiquinone/menaquinone biosynthesis C-methylase UbiE
MTNFWDELMGDDDHAASYMETYGEGPGFELRHKLGSLINPGESVLDVGMGPGWNYDHFKEFGPEVDYTGMDYSERFVRVAKARQPDAKFMVGDARKLPPVVGVWDVVIIQDCLEHTNGFEKPIYEALRVARKRVIVTFWHLEDSATPHINDDGNDGWGAWYDKREWEKFLDTLNLHWLHERAEIGNRNRDIYIIDKEANHG